MYGRAKDRFRVLLVLSALAGCALAPGIAGGQGRSSVDAPQDKAVHGQNGVKGATQASWNAPGVGAASPAARPRPQARGLEARVGALPFTGWDLIILGGVAMVLSGTGFALHRLSTPRAPYA